MLEIIIGSQRNRYAQDILSEVFHQCEWHGTLYIGYPVLATAGGPVSVDALLCCLEHGIVLFDFSGGLDGDDVAERQDSMHAAVFQKLHSTSALRRGRVGLAVDIKVVTVSPDLGGVLREGDVLVSPPAQLMSLVEEGSSIDPAVLESVNASIERVSTLKPQTKRPHVTRADSRGALIERIEREIANLDRWQKRAAIETPEGPQRIRGLAGSGKTIILALKAAYLHAQNPDWHIALTFHTRSLYQQLRDLVVRFSFETMNDEPNWERLRILHTWGSAYQPGIYSTIASHADQPVRDFNYGKSTYGYDGAFEGVCGELLNGISEQGVDPIFDAILIDEAQDLPKEFLQLCYEATKPPHRVVWAYDELQNLTQQALPPLVELFGRDEQGRARVEKLRTEGSPREDIILPVCYRNPPWTLSMAHALGFGIYRDEGLVQFFDEPKLWEEVGYEVMRGDFSPGSHVTLRRSGDSYPSYVTNLLEPRDAIQTHVFESKEAQAEWVAGQVLRNLTEDELRPQDILVVLCNPLTQKSDAAVIMEALAQHDLATHLAGVTSSVDSLLREGSIALSAIFRAKGNEAPIVYVLNSEYGAASGLELIKRRNVLFTAITRSKAWVRICGVGPAMERLAEEAREVVANEYQLAFVVPTAEDLDRLRRIHRDMPAAEKSRISKTERDFRDLLRRIESGELPSEVLSPDLKEQLERIMGDSDDSPGR